MVKYDSVSVGIAVKPESAAPKRLKNLELGLEYRVDMADFIITVSDHDGVVIKEKGDPSDLIAELKMKGTGNVTETFAVLERVEDSDGESVSSSERRGVNNNNNANSRNTIRNRPSCRKTRSENKLNSCNNGTSRAYHTGLKNNSSSPSSTVTFRSCDYYRQKLYEEDPAPSPEYNDWLNLSTIQKTAGQKVIKKLADQQKALEAEAEQQRKKSLASNSSAHSSRSGSDSESRNGSFLPPKKKAGRLEPIQMRSVRIAE